MLKCNLSRIMGEKRLKIADVARETGINRGTITRMYNETATRLDVEAIDSLCAYLNVQVGELYEHIESKNV